jgi:hypothetical protein
MPGARTERRPRAATIQSLASRSKLVVGRSFRNANQPIVAARPISLGAPTVVAEHPPLLEVG